MGIGGVSFGIDGIRGCTQTKVREKQHLGEIKMYKYKCVVNPQDTLVAYQTDNEIADETVFALVAENSERGTKVSVLLTVDDAELLCEQLHSFVKENV